MTAIRGLTRYPPSAWHGQFSPTLRSATSFPYPYPQYFLPYPHPLLPLSAILPLFLAILLFFPYLNPHFYNYPQIFLPLSLSTPLISLSTLAIFILTTYRYPNYLSLSTLFICTSYPYQNYLSLCTLVISIHTTHTYPQYFLLLSLSTLRSSTPFPYPDTAQFPSTLRSATERFSLLDAVSSLVITFGGYSDGKVHLKNTMSACRARLFMQDSTEDQYVESSLLCLTITGSRNSTLSVSDSGL